jgi:hypothetical protein
VVLTAFSSKIATLSRTVSFDTHTLIAFGRIMADRIVNLTVNDRDYDYFVTISGANAPTTGAAILLLKGINFGLSDRTMQEIRLAGSASEVSSWISDSALTCNSMAGVGLGYLPYGGLIVVTSAQYLVSWTEVFSFDDSTVSNVRVPNAPVSGSVFSTVSGQNFGSAADFTTHARFVNSAAMATFWTSDSGIRAKIPKGILDLSAVQVTASNDNRGSLTIAWSYDGGWTKLTNIKPMNSPLGGSFGLNHTLTMFGFKFSFDSFTISARVGKTACEMTKWIDDVTTLCVVPIGGFNGQAVDTVVTVNAGLFYMNTLSASFSYDTPSAYRSNPANAWHLFNSEALIEVLGNAFGSASYSFAARIHYTSCEASLWTSDSSISCSVPAGNGGTLLGVITVGSQGFVPLQYPLIPAGWHRSIGSMSEANSYDTPAFFPRITRQNVMRGGSGSRALFSLSGTQFGSYVESLRMKFGLTRNEATLWTSETYMLAIPAASLGGTNVLAITSALQVGCSGGIFSFDQPFTSLYTPLALTDDVCFEAFCGKNFSQLLIIGNNYGFVQSTVRGRIGFTTCAETIWLSVSSLTCKLAAGLALVPTIAVSVVVQVGTDLTAFTYFRRILSMESPNGKVTGGLSITIDGKYLGDADYTPQIRMGDTACDATEWISSVQVRCKVPGSIFRPEQIVLTLGPYCPSNYRAACEELWVPIVLLTKNAPTVGAASLTINGLGFQTSDPTGQIYIGGSACEASEWVSDLEVKCKVSAGSGHRKDLLVDINEQLVTLEQAFDYDDPVPSDINRANGPAGSIFFIQSS